METGMRPLRHLENVHLYQMVTLTPPWLNWRRFCCWNALKTTNKQLQKNLEQSTCSSLSCNGVLRYEFSNCPSSSNRTSLKGIGGKANERGAFFIPSLAIYKVDFKAKGGPLVYGTSVFCLLPCCISVVNEDNTYCFSSHCQSPRTYPIQWQHFIPQYSIKQTSTVLLIFFYILI